jgi:hypothetical protein
MNRRLRFPRIPHPHRPRRDDQRGVTTLVTAEPGTALRRFRVAALWAIAALIAAASGAAFTESYRGLYEWALHHGLTGFWAAAGPIQVDTFIGVGELTLFVAMVDGWRWRDRLGAWAVALLGLAVSVGGNIGHLAAADAQSRATAAVPPLAAFAALWLGLAVLKRVIGQRAVRQEASPGVLPADVIEAAGPVCPWPRPVPVMAASPKRPETQPLAVTTTAATASRAAAGTHPGSATGPRRRPQPRSGRNRNRKPVTDTAAEMHFAADLAAAQVPSVRRIQRELHVGQPRAKELRERMQSIITSRQPAP